MKYLLNAVRRGRHAMSASLFVVLACWGISPGAYAQIQPPPRPPVLQCTMSTSPSTISFGTISVARDAPVGTPLSAIRSSVTTINCPRNVWQGSRSVGFYLQYFPRAAVSTTVPDVWQTNIPGVGVRVISTSYDNKVLSEIPLGRWDDFAPNVGADRYSGSATFTYQLIKTGRVDTGAIGGSVSMGELLQLVSHNIPRNQTSSPPLSAIGIGNTTIMSRSCIATTPAVNVEMPTVNRTALDRVGDTAGTTYFRVGVSCQNDARLQVHMTLSDATTPGNRTDMLTLTRASTAQGVQLQITGPTGQVVRFGADSSAAETTNQFEIGPSQPVIDMPFSVKYISTGAVTPGTVTGLATFTMSYQ